MNRNEIIEMSNPPVSKHPAELILAGIKEKLRAFEQEQQSLVQQLEIQLEQVEQLQSKVEEHGAEKKIWLTQLVAYWQREVDLISLASQISGDLTPQQKQELLTRMQQLNQTNVKFAQTYQPKTSWVKKVFYLLITLLVLALVGWGLNRKYHWLKF